MLKNILGEPLLYFFVIATVLFSVNINKDAVEREIDVDTATISHLFEQRKQLQYEPLDEDLKQQLVDQHIDNEILYREALKRGLDNDTRIRKQLVQKMIMLLSEEIPEPTEEQVRQYFEENRDRFVISASRTFEHVYFADPANIPDGYLELLRSNEPAARRLGEESQLLGYRLPRKGDKELLMLFGQQAAETLTAIGDQLWHGPVQSRQGVHFVRLTQIHPARPEEFERIKNYLAQEWTSVQHEQQINRAIKGLRVQYKISTEWPQPR